MPRWRHRPAGGFAVQAAPACFRSARWKRLRSLCWVCWSITTYAETLSVYGTEKVFIDGDDTPYSKAFLASAYASRGIKVRCTSGTGSEALMGNAEKKSMLYLEARCLLVIKGAGVQGRRTDP